MGIVLYLAILWGWIPLCIYFLSKGGWTNIVRSLLLSAFMLILNIAGILIIEFSPLPAIGAIIGLALTVASLLA